MNDLQEQQNNATDEFNSSRYTFLSQGAEAKVWQGTFLGTPSIVKQRFNKKYRHPILDARLTQQRLKQEVRAMLKARKTGIRTPVVYNVDHNSIYMEHVPGHSIKTVIQQGMLSLQALERLATCIGQVIAKLHDASMIHGDLTTSNMLLVNIEDSENTPVEQLVHNLVLIDFGLSYISTLSEDKAVDLYVLERAFTSAHAESGQALFDAVLTSYRRTSKQWCSTLNKFAEVRMRGRKRSMVG